MTLWQRRARLAIGVFAVVFAVTVWLALKKRTPPAVPTPPFPIDPGTVVQSTGGHIDRFKLSQDEVSIKYDKLQTYADGRNKMIGVTITTVDKNGRTFTVTGREGSAGQNESTFA